MEKPLIPAQSQRCTASLKLTDPTRISSDDEIIKKSSILYSLAIEYHADDIISKALIEIDKLKAVDNSYTIFIISCCI